MADWSTFFTGAGGASLVLASVKGVAMVLAARAGRAGTTTTIATTTATTTVTPEVERRLLALEGVGPRLETLMAAMESRLVAARQHDRDRAEDRDRELMGLLSDIRADVGRARRRNEGG